MGLLALGSFSGPAVRPGGAAQITPAAPAVVPAAGGSLALMGGKFQINPADYPVIGSAKENALTAVLLSDFTCEWCLKYHSILENVTASAGQDVRILVLPIARSPQAGDIQRTLLTVFHAAPEAWHRLAALISSGQITATPDAVGRAALSLIGSDKFAAAAQLHADKIQEQLQLAADVLAGSRGRVETAVLPQLFSGSRVLTGAESDPAKVVAFLRDNSAPDPRPAPHPVLAMLTESVDLDALLPGKPRDFRVKLQNRGDAVLNIGWLALDEGCEVTSMPDKKVHPGEVAVIGLRLKPRAEGGNFTRRLQIHSDAPGGPSPINLHCRCAPSVAAASAP